MLLLLLLQHSSNSHYRATRQGVSYLPPYLYFPRHRPLLLALENPCKLISNYSLKAPVGSCTLILSLEWRSLLHNLGSIFYSLFLSRPSRTTFPSCHSVIGDWKDCSLSLSHSLSFTLTPNATFNLLPRLLFLRLYVFMSIHSSPHHFCCNCN